MLAQCELVKLGPVCVVLNQITRAYVIFIDPPLYHYMPLGLQ